MVKGSRLPKKINIEDININDLKKIIKQVKNKSKYQHKKLEKTKNEYNKAKEDYKNTLKDIKETVDKYKSKKLDISIVIYITFSKTQNSPRTVNVNYWFNPNQYTDTFYVNYIGDYISIAINNYIRSIDESVQVMGKELPVINEYIEYGQKNVVYMKMKATKIIKINHLFNETIEDIEMIDKCCVLAYLIKTYKHNISEKKIKAYFPNSETGIDTNELLKFCTEYKIKLVAYNIDGKCITSFYPEEKGKLKNLVYIAYDNHMYPLKNRVLTKKFKRFSEKYEIITDVEAKLIENLDNDKEVTDINVNDNKIKSFVVDDIRYVENQDYEQCKKLLELFGLSDRLDCYTNRFNVLEKIEQLFNYNNNRSTSFLPQPFVKGGFKYSSSSFDKKRPYFSLDKVKSYPHALYELPYLLRCNFMQNEVIEKYDETLQKDNFDDNYEIVDEYLYIVNPLTTNIIEKFLLPKTNIYFGHFLKKVKNEGIKFTIIECFKCDKVPNFLREMISKLMFYLENGQIDMEFLKQCLVVWIGKMDVVQGTKISNIFKCVSNNKDETIDGFNHELKSDDKSYFIKYDSIKSFSVQNRKPINIQIKDMSRWVMYEEIKKIGIKSQDIIDFNTDCVTFYTDKLNDFDRKKYTDNKSFLGFKDETYKFYKDKPNNPNSDNICSFKMSRNYNINSICDAPAGSGKTYQIIKYIEDNKVDDYIILCPTHDTKSDYKDKQMNVQVYQYFIFNNKIPSQKNIFIDELGLFDRAGNELIYKCYLDGKNIKSWGDFEQMLPVNECSPFNNIEYLKKVYGNFDKLDVNMRNTFNKEYYEKLKKSKNNYWLLSEVKKHSTKSYKDSEVIICYYNDSCKLYNKLMLEHLGFKSMLDNGVSLMCFTNNLAKYEIYNKTCMKVVRKQEDKYILSNEFKEYILDEHELIKNFRPSYARTIYGIQGKSFKSYYWADIKKDFSKELEEQELYVDDYKIDGRSAYTVISRIKEDINKVIRHNELNNMVEIDGIFD